MSKLGTKLVHSSLVQELPRNLIRPILIPSKHCKSPVNIVLNPATNPPNAAVILCQATHFSVLPTYKDLQIVASPSLSDALAGLPCHVLSPGPAPAASSQKTVNRTKRPPFWLSDVQSASFPPH